MSISLIIILITVLLSLAAFQNNSLLEKFLFRPYLMKQSNEWWRWISCGFIHKDYGHLLVNMLSFYFFGAVVEQMYSSITGNGMMYLIFYVSAIAVSGMYDYHRYQNRYEYAALGASGAVSAVIFSYIMFDPFGKIYLYFMIGLPAWLFGVLYLWYEYYLGRKESDNIGHNAHFFGAVYGLVFPVIIYPETGLYFIQKIISIFPTG